MERGIDVLFFCVEIGAQGGWIGALKRTLWDRNKGLKGTLWDVCADQAASLMLFQAEKQKRDKWLTIGGRSHGLPVLVASFLAKQKA